MDILGHQILDFAALGGWEMLVADFLIVHRSLGPTIEVCNHIGWLWFILSDIERRIRQNLDHLFLLKHNNLQILGGKAAELLLKTLVESQELETAQSQGAIYQREEGRGARDQQGIWEDGCWEAHGLCSPQWDWWVFRYIDSKVC